MILRGTIVTPKYQLIYRKKFPLWARTILSEFGPKLCDVMPHHSLSEGLFEILWHDKARYRQEKVALVIFLKFRNTLSLCGVIVRPQSYQLIFQKKISFWTTDNLAKIMKPYSRDLLCGNFFEMTWHDGIQQLDQASVGQLL